MNGTLQVQDLASQILSHDITSFVGQRHDVMHWPPAFSDKPATYTDVQVLSPQEVLRLFRRATHTHKRQLFTQKLGAFSQNCCNASSWFSSARPNLSAFHRSTLCPLLAALAGLLNTFLQFCWHFGLCFGSSFGNCLGLRLVVSGRSKCCFRWFWLLFGVPVKSLGAVWGAVFVPLSGPALGLVFDVVLFAACRHPSGSFCNYLTLLLEFLDAVFSAALRRYLRRDFLHKQHPPLHL